MNTSMVGKQYMSNLNSKADILYESRNGESNYKYAEPYDTIKDDFVLIASSPDTTDDEKSIAKLGLLINDSWAPDAGLKQADILNAHRGMLEVVEKEYGNMSKTQIGSVLARATLNSISATMSLTHLTSALQKESVTSALLGDGFEAIMSSNATKKEKALAKSGLKNMSDYTYEDELPHKMMKDIAGKAIK